MQQNKIEANDRVLIVDSMNTFLRCFAIINHVNPQNDHIGGLTGFLKSIGYAIRFIKPTKVVLVFEGQGSIVNKRYLYPEYKANRNTASIVNYNTFDNKDEETEAMTSQIIKLVQYLKLLPVHVLSIDKIEADDVIGHLCNRFNKEVYVMSTDQDFLQLASNRVTIYNPTKKKLYDPSSVLNEYGVLSENFINYKILLGDKGDNVPGIKGIGEKKLIKLYPELTTQQLDLKDLLTIAESKKAENNLYQKILEQNKQLEINKQLMDLKNPNIPEHELENIEYVVTQNNSNLDTISFLSYYNNDLLGNSIPRIEMWLEETFRHLTFFK